jgi:hypothetical protein
MCILELHHASVPYLKYPLSVPSTLMRALFDCFPADPLEIFKSLQRTRISGWDT